MKDKKIIISDIDYIIGKNSEITDDTHMDLVDEIADYIEQLLTEDNKVVERDAYRKVKASERNPNEARYYHVLFGEFLECREANFHPPSKYWYSHGQLLDKGEVKYWLEPISQSSPKQEEVCKHTNTTWVGAFSICEDCGVTL